MKPNKAGQIVKFHTPYPDENPNQLYVILEIHEDVEKPRALIKELKKGLPFPSIITVLVKDLVIAEVDTSDLLHQKVKIFKADNSLVEGNVIKVSEKKVIPEMTVSENGVKTDVFLTIIDNKGVEHTGKLYI